MMAVLFQRLPVWIILMIMLQDVSIQQPNTCDPPCQNGSLCTTTDTGPKCLCPPDLTGALCETPINDCVFPTTNNCQNNAQCVDGLGNYTCACPSGWEGRFCEKDINECSQIPAVCRNETSCTNSPGSFACSCVPGYTGRICETEIDECASTPCHFNGQCVDLVNNFRCDCQPGFLGDTCEAVVRRCELDKPCGMKGVCVDIPKGGYQCFCQPGYYGDHCESLVNLCLSKPCRNGAACANSGINYTCNCLPGYSGRNCEMRINGCSPTPCLNNGTCTEVFPSSFTCQCVAGFTGSRCEMEINECQSNPCQGKQSCVDLLLGYRCECPPGTTGELCETNIFDCRLTPCVNNGTCCKEGGAYVCICPSPYTDPTCATSLDPCTPNPCLYNGRCSRFNETIFACDCLDGFIGKRCEGDIYDCLSNPCLNGGSCEEILYDGNIIQNTNSADSNLQNGTRGNQTSRESKFFCLCPDSFTGTLCETDFIACLSNPCKNGATCISKTNTDYTCICGNGWSGNQCDQDVNECIGMAPVCLNGGQCINKTPGFRCVCSEPWTGSRCDVQVLNCANLRCLNGGTCVENVGKSSYCICPAEFTDIDCSVKLKPCAPNPCYNNATCQDLNINDNTSNGHNFTCHCTPGYTGDLCEGNIDECTTLKPCLNNATCLDAINGYQCQCLAGWSGPTCGENIDECLSRPCLNGGNCTDLVNGFSCKCDFGYAGDLCEGNIDECTTLKPCLNNATCLDAINGYQCQCLAGWSGPTCGENIDECLSRPCLNGGNCTDLVNGFSCKCDFGYAGATCSTEVNECSYEPCLNNATCEDKVNGFICSCLPGFSGVACSTDIDECASSPCNGSATCVDGINTFTCLCPPGFQGSFCEEDILECSSDPCKNGGTCIEPEPATFSCTCPSGVEGDTCQIISSADFDGRKALTFLSLVQLYNKDGGQNRRVSRAAVDSAVAGDGTQLQLQFTTTVLDGILLIATGILSNGLPQHVVLELRSSVVYISANNGRQLLKGSIGLANKSEDIHSHFIHVAIGNAALDVIINPETCGSNNRSCLSENLGFNNVTSWNLNGTVHFGGVAEFTPYVRNLVQDVGGFVGCLGALKINAQQINLADAEQFVNPGDKNGSAPSFGCAAHSACLEVPCLNGGTCQDLWINKSCVCISGYSGPTCNFQNMAHFETDSMLHFASTMTLITELSFVFSAATATGLLMYTVAMDSLSFSLDGGQLILRLFRYNNITATSRVGSNLHLQDWVKVNLQLDNNKFTIEVSSNTSGSLGSSTGTTGDNISVTGSTFWGILLNDSVTDKWRGGDILLPTQSIKGCIRDITINKTPLNLSTSSPYSNSDPPKARPGCEKEEACLVIACQNGGVCVPNWASPTCKCDESYTGDNCSQESATTFDGKISYSLINLDRSKYSFGNGGRIEFRTRQADSTLMLLQFFSLSGMVDNFIEFRISKGMFQAYSSFSNEMIGSSRDITDGQWHYLDWVRADSSSFLLNLDHTFLILKAEIEPNQLTLNKTMQVFVGARPYLPGNSSLLFGFFKGCMKGVSFNNESLPYTSKEAVHPGLNVNPVGLVSGCSGDAVCSVNTCPANSYCVDEWNYFVCPCLEGWEGMNCVASVDDCRNNSCRNGGTCLDNHLSFSCNCGPKFTGTFCETTMEACQENNTCQVNNTESCILFNSSDVKCNCRPGYTGKTCDSAINNCVPNLCVNNATCENGVNNFTCVCQDGFLGSLCEIENYCHAKPCYHDGLCILASERNKSNSNSTVSTSLNFKQYSNSNSTENSENSDRNVFQSSFNSSNLTFICQCVPPYFGIQCQSYNCCLDNKCKNNGTCNLDANNCSCHCKPGYYGDFCENTDYCISMPCMNGGSCKNNGDSFICLCPINITGVFCESFANKCVNNTCLNSGICIYNSSTSSSLELSSNSTTICVCKVGYTGQRCETDVNKCDSLPCLNNGTCTEHSKENSSIKFDAGFVCDCAAGFQGYLCEQEINDCNSNPCQNGGVCKDLVGNFSCSCPGGFSGRICEHYLQGCSSNPCQNVAECDGAGENFTCLCSSGFTGTYCESSLAQKSDLGEGALAAIIVICVIIFILIVVLIIWQVRKRRKTRGRYKPAEVEGQIRNGDIYMNRLANGGGERMI